MPTGVSILPCLKPQKPNAVSALPRAPPSCLRAGGHRRRAAPCLAPDPRRFYTPGSPSHTHRVPLPSRRTAPRALCGHSGTRQPAGREGGGQKGRKGKGREGGDPIRSHPIPSDLPVPALPAAGPHLPGPAQPPTAPNGPQRPRSPGAGAGAAAARCPPPAVGRGRGSPLPPARSAPFPPRPRGALRATRPGGEPAPASF